MKSYIKIIFVLFCNLFFTKQINAQIIYTIAGTGTAGFSGNSGQATAAQLNNPAGVSIDAFDNIYIADCSNNCVRKINSSNIITTIAGNGTQGFSGDGGQATAAELNKPQGIAFDALGNIYIADINNNRIRKIDNTGIITTIAGNGTHGFSGDGGQATNAELSFPYSIAFDSHNNLYISDENSNRIRKVNNSGIINTVAGNGSLGRSGDGGQATNAEINIPYGIKVNMGNLYIVDYWEHVIRMVDTLGIITTIAGNGLTGSMGAGGYSGDGGQATDAQLYHPTEIAFDAANNLYIADKDNNRIRVVGSSGIINTVVGNGTHGFNGDGGQATSSELNGPSEIACNSLGNLYIADTYNNRIRMVTNISTVNITKNFNINNDEIKVYPNPANSNINVTTIKNIIELKLIDVLGKEVISTKEKNIDITNLSNGVYFIQVKTYEGVATKKIVVQH